MADEAKPKDDRIVKGLQAILEMYGKAQLLANNKATQVSPANLRNILRDIAQTMLIGFFQQGTSQQHQDLLQSLIADYNTVTAAKSDVSQSVRSKTMLRLKVAKDIFRSALSKKVVKQSDLIDQVTAICGLPLD